MKTVIKNGGLGIRQYIEKLKGTLCTHIVYDVGVSGILPFSLPPAGKGEKDDRKGSKEKMVSDGKKNQIGTN